MGREEHILCFRSVRQIVVTISCFVWNARTRWAKFRVILRELFYLLARGKYDPIKRFAALRKTNWHYSQEHTCEEGREEGGKKNAIRFTRANS